MAFWGNCQPIHRPWGPCAVPEHQNEGQPDSRQLALPEGVCPESSAPCLLREGGVWSGRDESRNWLRGSGKVLPGCIFIMRRFILCPHGEGAHSSLCMTLTFSPLVEVHFFSFSLPGGQTWTKSLLMQCGSGPTWGPPSHLAWPSLSLQSLSQTPV